MRPRPASSLLAAVAVLGTVAVGGCGGGNQVAEVRPWVKEELYLPPPAPTASPSQAAADGDVAAPEPASAGVAPATSTRATAEPRRGAEVASGAPSDAQIAAELREGFKYTGKGSIVDAASVTRQGMATVPPTAPPKVAAMILAANQVARKPYVYGGGHGGGPEGLFIDSAYDCSGSMSFALASAGLLKAPTNSTGFESFGKAGPGKWVTIYANAGHAFMVIAGLRFDTSGRAESGTRWQAAPRTVSGFKVRHPAGL